MSDMKKYWLTVEQRDTIVSALLSKQNGLEAAIEKEKPKLSCLPEMVEQSRQETDMLVSLFKVHENERN